MPVRDEGRGAYSGWMVMEQLENMVDTINSWISDCPTRSSLHTCTGIARKQTRTAFPATGARCQGRSAQRGRLCDREREGGGHAEVPRSGRVHTAAASRHTAAAFRHTHKKILKSCFFVHMTVKKITYCDDAADLRGVLPAYRRCRRRQRARVPQPQRRRRRGELLLQWTKHIATH